MTPPMFTQPLSMFVLADSNMDSPHNLRMIHEGRTIVTFLVSAGVDSSCSGKSIPGPAVLLYPVPGTVHHSALGSSFALICSLLSTTLKTRVYPSPLLTWTVHSNVQIEYSTGGWRYSRVGAIASLPMSF